jgi:outer membrane protein insertion porin family
MKHGRAVLLAALLAATRAATPALANAPPAPGGAPPASGDAPPAPGDTPPAPMGEIAGEVPAPAVPAVAPAAEATAPAAPESLQEPAPRPPTGTFAIGVGFTPDDGFFARAEVAQADLLRTGQRLALSADVSAIRQHFRLVHEVPALLGSGLDLQSELFSSRRAYPAFTREATGGAVTLGKRLSRATRVYTRYRVEHVTMDLAAPGAPRPLGAELGASPSMMPAAGATLGAGLFASLGAGLAYSTLDAPVLPRRGSRLELFAERADRRLGSAYELVRAGGIAEHARPLGPFTLRLHGHAAAVHSRDPMGVPLAFRLQHEGHATVRGYSLEAGSPGGHNFEAAGKVELELPIVPKWGLSIAGFVDAGLRYNADAAWGPRGALLQRSVGVSVIWRSPIGLLRFDWAIPLDGDRRDAQFLFGFGGAR